MKKKVIYSLFLIAVMSTFNYSQAQILAFSQKGGAGVEGYSIPRTVVTVTLVQEQETIIRGPYSRYAAKYLGITDAAQSDRMAYRIVGAHLGYNLEADPSATFMFDSRGDVPVRSFAWQGNGNIAAPTTPAAMLNGADASSTYGSGLGAQFSDMGISGMTGSSNLTTSGSENYLRMDGVDKNTDQMASDAAAAIFRLRKRRFELVTGEQGEGVFGQGLPAALAEIDRLEKEYLALFIGKRYVNITEHKFAVMPSDAARGRITVCRFTETAGITADSDMSARPINVEYMAERGGSAATSASSAKPMGKSSARTLPYRVPRYDLVKVMDGVKMLTQERIPFYQFGTTSDMPVL